MTSGRFRVPTFALLVGAVTLASLGCNGDAAQGCTECAPVEGLYTLRLDPGTTPSSCNGMAVELPRGPLEVERQGSDISAELDGLTLRGTLYAANDFNLMGVHSSLADGGTGGPDSASLSGRYIPADGDGGVPSLTGDWMGNFSSTTAGGTRRCTVTRSFTATRQ